MSRRLRSALVACLLLGPAALLTSAQTADPGVHPLSGRHYAQTMSYQNAAWLDRAERMTEEEPDKALDAIHIVKGSTVADVGAGSGYMTAKLAAHVGPAGRVYANDIQPEMLDLLRQRMAKSGIRNVEPVLGAVDDPKLPEHAIDLILMVDVYHEFSHPQEMLRNMRRELKDDGRLVLVEYRKEADIPIKLEHRMAIGEAKLEVEAEGYALDRIDESLPRQHILIFRKAEAPPPAAPRISDVAPASVGGDIVPPRRLVGPSPIYPAAAQKKRLQGTVYVEAMIGKDGNVKDVTITFGNPVFAQAVFEALQQWKYTPTLRQGEPIEVRLYTQVIFQLK